MKRLSLCSLLVAWLCTIGACEDEAVPVTQVIVAITSDLEPGVELTRIEIEISDASGEITLPSSYYDIVAADPRPAQRVLPLTLGVHQGKQPVFRLTVNAYAPDAYDQPIVVQRRVVRFASGRSLLLPIVIERACVTRLCASDGSTSCALRPADETGAGESYACLPVDELGVDELDQVDPERFQLPDAGPSVVDEDMDAGAAAGGPALTWTWNVGGRSAAGTGGRSGRSSTRRRERSGGAGGAGGAGGMSEADNAGRGTAAGQGGRSTAGRSANRGNIDPPAADGGMPSED